MLPGCQCCFAIIPASPNDFLVDFIHHYILLLLLLLLLVLGV